MSSDRILDAHSRHAIFDHAMSESVHSETLSPRSSWLAMLRPRHRSLSLLLALCVRAQVMYKQFAEHEQYCLNCHDGGLLYLCQSCPRGQLLSTHAFAW